MERKDLKVIGGVVISAIVVAFVINCLLTYGNIIVTSLTNDSWLNFWGSYISGVFAVIVGYLAIVYSNRNSEKAIKQQERVLIHQQNIKKVDEYNACLRKNLELFNIADLRGIMAGIDHQNLLTSMMSISKMKAQIFATDLQYRYIFEVDTQKEKTELENKYNEWWIKARTGLSTILDMELNFTLIYFNVPTLKFWFNTYTKICNFRYTMETLNESLGRTPVPLVESIVQINPQNSQSSKRLMVQLDLSKLDSSTLAALWNDSSVNWSKLSKSDLRKLYNALGKTKASFTEWMKANGF